MFGIITKLNQAIFLYTLLCAVNFNNMEEQKFTIEEIRNYIMSQDSLGDVMYNLKAEKIIEANKPEEDDEDDYQFLLFITRKYNISNGKLKR